VNLTSKKVLLIDLEKEASEVKSYADLQKYVGGVGLGLKLMHLYKDLDPLVLSVGPLNGFFPFASKTSVVLNDSGVIEDLYIGGTLSARIKFTGIDSIVICGKAKDKSVLEIIDTEVTFKPADTEMGSLGLPGRRSIVAKDDTKFFVDKYFTTPEYFLETKLEEKNIIGLAITGTETFKPVPLDKYQELYHKILARKSDITVLENVHPSCFNCPMGCDRSRVGELGGNVLIHSLVACQYAEKIYSDVGVVFSCLNILGYDYTHEDIENLPKLIEETLKNLN